MTVRTKDGVSRSEARLEAMAVRRGWNLPESLKQKIVDRAVALMDAGPRYEAIAIGCLSSMERTNLEAERLELDRAKFEHAKEVGGTDGGVATIITAPGGVAEVRRRLAAVDDPALPTAPEG